MTILNVKGMLNGKASSINKQFDKQNDQLKYTIIVA